MLKGKKYLFLWVLSLVGWIGTGIKFGWFSYYSVILFAVVMLVSFLFVWFFLAPNDLFFTFVPESTAKVILRGDKVKKIFITWKGYALDEDWNVVPLEEKESVLKKSFGEKLKSPLLRPLDFLREIFGGLKFYGLWPLYDVYVYEFTWSSRTPEGEIRTHKDELLDYIYLRPDVYFARVTAAEDKQLLPLDVDLLLTIRVVNPYKALFRIEKWLEAVLNRIEPSVRDFITTDTYDNLITQQKAIGKMIFAALSKSEEEQADRSILQIFREDYGVLVEAIEVVNIEPPEEYRKVTLAKFEAEREKERIKILAEAEEERVSRVYEAVQKFGQLGQLLRTLESVRESPLAASLSIQAVPGIQEIFRGVFGRPFEEVSPEEIKELREKIEELSKNIQGGK